MGGKDCCFLIGYACSFISFVIFMIGFSRPDWMTYKYGHAGLWMDCFENLTKSDEINCYSSAKAEGPAFLELTRTFMILALVLEAMGMIGYNFFPKKMGRPETCCEQIKGRMQEFSHFLAGVLTVLGLVTYGMNYYEYYTDEKARENVELNAGFYMSLSAAILAILVSLIIGLSRDTGLIEHFTKRQRDKRLKELRVAKQNADTRKVWLKNKKVPTPSDQKVNNEDANDEVVVKESALKKIVMPINVILAYKRLKKGTGRKQEQEAIDREERDIEYLEFKEASKLDDAENKVKGIFTIEGETRTRPILTPPTSTRRSNTSTPRSVRIVAEPDSTSTFSSSSTSSSSPSSSYSSSSDFTSEDLMVTATDGAILPSANAVAAAVEVTLPPRKTNEAIPTDTQKPQKVRRAATTLKDNSDSRHWAVDHSAQAVPSKLKPKRHLSHDAIKSERSKQKKKTKKTTEQTSPSSIPGKSIYSLPTDGAHRAHLPPPKYEEVIGGSQHSHYDAPQPVMTDQSRVYQPYSKSKRTVDIVTKYNI